MDNPTIYRYPKKIIDNPDGTKTEVEKGLRKNRDINVIIKIKNPEGYTKVEAVEKPCHSTGVSYDCPFNGLTPMNIGV